MERQRLREWNAETLARIFALDRIASDMLNLRLHLGTLKHATPTAKKMLTDVERRYQNERDNILSGMETRVAETISLSEVKDGQDKRATINPTEVEWSEERM